MSVRVPCIECGEPTTGTRCDEHRLTPWRDNPRANTRVRGYGAAWKRLSAKARALQPFCIDEHLGGCKGPLQTDHTPEAWRRYSCGLPVRMCDVAVRCALHNVRAGAARGESVTRTH